MKNYKMNQKYSSFLEDIFLKFPALKQIVKIDSNQFLQMELEELLYRGYMNFVASRKELHRLSELIEEYAIEKKTPLITSFEESKFESAEERYLKIMKKIPYTWVIENIKNTSLIQCLPENVKSISCDGTNLELVWIVLTKGPHGPMGLVAEKLADGRFEGFFSVSSEIIKETVEEINRKLNVNLDLTKKFDY